MIWAQLIQTRRHFVRPNPVAPFSNFIRLISTEADDIALDQHVKSITVGQRFFYFHVQMIFTHL
ncbi:hypothetical protein D3C78_1993080 [compost metagenome]